MTDDLGKRRREPDEPAETEADLDDDRTFDEAMSDADEGAASTSVEPDADEAPAAPGEADDDGRDPRRDASDYDSPGADGDGTDEQ